MRQVLHITDVHFGADHQPDRSAGLVELSRQRRPDLVAFSGDVTKRAKPAQFQEARRFVEALGAPTVIVPGNHDVPLFRVWERVFQPYGAYRRHFDRDLEPTFVDDELLVIGVNTAWGWTFTGGRVWPWRARRLERQLLENKGSRFAIVLLHHQMIPVPPYGSLKVFRHALGTARALDRGGADLVLSGHVHLSYLGHSEDLGEGAPRGLPVLFSGTPSSSRGRGPEKGLNSCHWLEIGDRDIAIERLEWSSQEAAFVGAERRRLERRPSG